MHYLDEVLYFSFNVSLLLVDFLPVTVRQNLKKYDESSGSQCGDQLIYSTAEAFFLFKIDTGGIFLKRSGYIKAVHSEDYDDTPTILSQLTDYAAVS